MKLYYCCHIDVCPSVILVLFLQAFLSLTAVCYMLHVFPRQLCEIKAMKSLLCRMEIKKTPKRTRIKTCFVCYLKRIHRISRLLVRSWPITTMLMARQRHKQEVRADHLSRCAPVEQILVKAEQQLRFSFPPSLLEEGTMTVSDWR